MKTRRTDRDHQAGFTMIEVMVAVLLTAIAVIGIVGLFRVQTRNSDYSRRSTEAAVLAADKMEELRMSTIAGATTGSEANIDSRGQAGGPFTRSWDVSAPTTTQWKLEVAVTWDDDGTTRTVKLDSLRGL